MALLKEIGVDDTDLRIIPNQTANVRVDNQLTEAVSRERRVRQGCIL